MSTLLIDELYDGINFDQPITIERDLNIIHVRPWIMKWGTLVDGDFTCEVYDGATLLATSTISYTDINAEFTDDYAHGFIRFDFDSLSLRIPEGSIDKEYTFRFYMDNHTTDASNFISIVRRWEAKVYDTYGTGVIDNEAPNDSVEPAGIELYNYKLI